MTKYDCSSGDLNPIGSISKADLSRFLAWAAAKYNLPVLTQVLTAPPTAELEPITANYTQTDEAGLPIIVVCFAGLIGQYSRHGDDVQ